MFLFVLVTIKHELQAKKVEIIYICKNCTAPAPFFFAKLQMGPIKSHHSDDQSDTNILGWINKVGTAVFCVF